MTFKSGQIFRIKDYTFEDDGTTRDKYTIVLFCNTQFAYLIHCLTTSQNKFEIEVKNYGCSIHENKFPYYVIPKHQIIGDKGFYFDKDTFIFFRDNVRKENFEKFEKAASNNFFGLATLGTLTSDELKRLIKCALKSKFVAKQIAEELQLFKEVL